MLNQGTQKVRDKSGSNGGKEVGKGLGKAWGQHGNVRQGPGSARSENKTLKRPPDPGVKDGSTSVKNNQRLPLFPGKQSCQQRDSQAPSLWEWTASTVLPVTHVCSLRAVPGEHSQFLFGDTWAQT